jgi:hypothetical protein
MTDISDDTTHISKGAAAFVDFQQLVGRQLVAVGRIDRAACLTDTSASIFLQESQLRFSDVRKSISCSSSEAEGYRSVQAIPKSPGMRSGPNSTYFLPGLQ